jgi:L-ribulose-5-phosphate 3-epimerase
MVPFEKYLKELKRHEVTAPFSIHYEYPLGGAEHGASNLSISKEQFTEQVGADLGFFTNLYAHQ